jgi:hypothetical protein
VNIVQMSNSSCNSLRAERIRVSLSAAQPAGCASDGGDYVPEVCRFFGIIISFNWPNDADLDSDVLYAKVTGTPISAGSDSH